MTDLLILLVFLVIMLFSVFIRVSSDLFDLSVLLLVVRYVLFLFIGFPINSFTLYGCVV